MEIAAEYDDKVESIARSMGSVRGCFGSHGSDLRNWAEKIRVLARERDRLNDALKGAQEGSLKNWRRAEEAEQRARKTEQFVLELEEQHLRCCESFSNNTHCTVSKDSFDKWDELPHAKHCIKCKQMIP